MTRRKRLGLLLVGFVLLIAGTTMFALEGGDVAVLETMRNDGSPRRTRVWFAETGEGILIEAAHPAREFLGDIAAHDVIRLTRHGETVRYRATVLANPQGHLQIRQQLHEKYGWADTWISFFTDTAQSLAVRLERVAP